MKLSQLKFSICPDNMFHSAPGAYPPTGLIAQRINVYRGVGGYKPTGGLTEEAGGDGKVSKAS